MEGTSLEQSSSGRGVAGSEETRRDPRQHFQQVVLNRGREMKRLLPHNSGVKSQAILFFSWSPKHDILQMGIIQKRGEMKGRVLGREAVMAGGKSS